LAWRRQGHIGSDVSEFKHHLQYTWEYHPDATSPSPAGYYRLNLRSQDST
jgi:hypothetical protein